MVRRPLVARGSQQGTGSAVAGPCYQQSLSVMMAGHLDQMVRTAPGPGNTHPAIHHTVNKEGFCM